MICPDVGRFHPRVAVLTVCSCITRKITHPCHFAHSTTRVFYEPISWLKLTNECKNMLVNEITELSIITDRIKIACFWILMPVMADCRDAECCTVGAGPYHIWMAKLIEDVLCGDSTNVGVPVDIFKIFAPFNAIDLMAVSLECLADTACTSE